MLAGNIVRADLRLLDASTLCLHMLRWQQHQRHSALADKLSLAFTLPIGWS